MVVYTIKGYPIFLNKLGYNLNSKEKEELNLLEFEPNNKNLISKGRYILDNPNFNNLSNFFDQNVKFYLEEVLQINDKLNRTNSWVTLNKSGSYHTLHVHPNVFLSVCFYPQIEDGDLIFNFGKNILQEGYLFEYNIKTPNIYNQDKFSFPLTSNNLIIFPGWIPHKTSPNNSDVDRIMIGANYFLTGNLGKDVNTSFLKL
jgi:uncharacterized protein (TIGR02466 family)